MEDWNWEKGDVLKGTGQIIKKGFILKFQHIDELKFKIKGRFSTGSKGSETVKDILYFQLGVEEIEVKHLPVSVVDIIMNGLWEINVEHINRAQLNGKPLKKKDIVLDMAKKVADDQVVKKVYLELLGDNQEVDINLEIRKKKDLKGEIVFRSPVYKRNADKFTKELGRLLPLFVKKEIKTGKRGKHKDDGSPPLEYGGPGQEPVKWYSVHGRG